MPCAPNLQSQLRVDYMQSSPFNVLANHKASMGTWPSTYAQSVGRPSDCKYFSIRWITSRIRDEIIGSPSTGRSANFDACVRYGRLTSMPCAGSPSTAAVKPLKFEGSV